MQSKNNSMPVEPKKKVVIWILFAVAVAICISGASFSVYSYMNDISFKVINTQISGIIFGVAILYLGVRYFLSLMKLKNEVYKPTSRFSWENFKKGKRKKSK
jgi:hypothetical protein